MNELQNQLTELALADVKGLVEKGKDYGDSWKKRGGVGAFMMLARKWDRLEGQVQKDPKWDVFEHGAKDTRLEGLLDDISDLRRYLLLVEAEIRNLRTARTKRSPILDYARTVQSEGGPYLGAYEVNKISPVSSTGNYPNCQQDVREDRTGQTNPFGYDPYQDTPRDPNVGDTGMSVQDRDKFVGGPGSYK